jgi:hypothetical protein
VISKLDPFSLCGIPFSVTDQKAEREIGLSAVCEGSWHTEMMNPIAICARLCHKDGEHKSLCRLRRGLPVAGNTGDEGLFSAMREKAPVQQIQIDSRVKVSTTHSRGGVA